jgi:hypothetical protein
LIWQDSATQAVAGDGAVAGVDDFDDLIDARDVFAFVLEASGQGPLASDRLIFMGTSEVLVATVLLVSRRERPMSACKAGAQRYEAPCGKETLP